MIQSMKIVKEVIKLDWTKLFNMQAKLDQYIAENHKLTEKDNLVSKRYLALLVELGELANETRCFKFWSTKAPSHNDVILEEYVDGVHFILSLGLELGYRFHSSSPIKVVDQSLTDQFNAVFAACTSFNATPDIAHYEALFVRFLELGQLLGFTEADIQTAYMKKNEVNFERQDAGY